METFTENRMSTMSLAVHMPLSEGGPLNEDLPKPRVCPACGSPARVVRDAVVVVMCSNLLCRSSPKTDLWQPGYERQAIEQWNHLRGIKKWAVQGPRHKPPLD